MEINTKEEIEEYLLHVLEKSCNFALDKMWEPYIVPTSFIKTDGQFTVSPAFSLS